MTVTAHNVLILSLIVVCLALVRRFPNRHKTSPGHDLRLVILAIVRRARASGVTAIDADTTLIVSRAIGICTQTILARALGAPLIRPKSITNEWGIGALGSALCKHFVSLDLVGKGAEGRVSGMFFADENQHLSYNTLQRHLAPRTTSDLLFKGALNGKSRSVWRIDRRRISTSRCGSRS